MLSRLQRPTDSLIHLLADVRSNAPLTYAVEVEWTLDNAIEKYLEMSAARVKDDEDRYGPFDHRGYSKLNMISSINSTYTLNLRGPVLVA